MKIFNKKKDIWHDKYNLDTKNIAETKPVSKLAPVVENENIGSFTDSGWYKGMLNDTTPKKRLEEMSSSGSTKNLYDAYKQNPKESNDEISLAFMKKYGKDHQSSSTMRKYSDSLGIKTHLLDE